MSAASILDSLCSLRFVYKEWERLSMATQEASMLSDSRSPGSVQGAKRGCVMLGCRGHCMLFLWLSCAKEFGYLAFWSRHFHWRWMYGYMAHCILECQSSNTEFLQEYITNWYAFWKPACQPWHATSARLIVSTNWQRKEEAKSSKRKASAAKRIIGRAFK